MSDIDEHWNEAMDNEQDDWDEDDDEKEISQRMTDEDFERLLDKYIEPGAMAYKLREALKAERSKVAELEAERDDYKSRWEQTGCTRHFAMEQAIKLAEKRSVKIAELEARVEPLQPFKTRILELEAENAALKRGEFICQKCGLRKDSEFERGDF